MPDWLVQRRFHRYPIQLPLAYKPGGATSGGVRGGWTCDLSAGGACLELGERLRPQAVVQVRLRTVHGPIDVGAEVVWAGEPTSPAGGIPHGVAFEHLTPEQFQALQSLQALPLSPSGAPQARVRLPVDFAVTCQPKRPARATVQGRVGDMSRGGMLLRLPEILAPGTEVEITLQTTTGSVRVAGEIVWVDRLGSADSLYPPPVYEIFGETVWLDLPERRTPEEPPIRHGLQFTPLDRSVSLSLGLVLAESA